jgi:hypothetical protein
VSIHNSDIAAVFEEIADLLEIKDRTRHWTAYSSQRNGAYPLNPA